MEIKVAEKPFVGKPDEFSSAKNMPVQARACVATKFCG
jgi:hypothetical protein